MQHLSPGYLSAIAAQLGGLSAFLGGFAAAFLVTLLSKGDRSRTTSLSIGFSVSSSVAFIITVMASTGIVAALHPEAPPAIASSLSPLIAQTTLTLAFVVGLYALLLSLAFSGWSRSRGTGVVTSIAACVGMIMVSLMLVKIG